jgi:hypothetical protein
MKTFKEYITEGNKSVVRNALATAMVGAGLINATGIPAETVPKIVYDYWQEKIAPTRDQQIYKLSKKYEKHAIRDSRGRRVLDIDSIPDENDRNQFHRLVSQQG